MKLSGLVAPSPSGSRHLTRHGETRIFPYQPPLGIGGGATWDRTGFQYGGYGGYPSGPVAKFLQQNNGGGGGDATVITMDGRSYLAPFVAASGVPNGNDAMQLLYAQTAAQQGHGFFMPTAAVQRVANSPLTPQLLAFVMEAHVRKIGAGDIIPSGAGIGFRRVQSGLGANPNLQVTYQGGGGTVDARVGFFGDGNGGFRFQSWHCPGPDNVPLVALNYADANAVQPASAVAPGTAEMHIRLKWIQPISAAQPGQLLCYFEGQLVATFALAANLPAWWSSPGFWACGTQAAGCQFALRDIHYWYDEDLSATF